MILATVLIALPLMGLLIGYDFWHCRDRRNRITRAGRGHGRLVTSGRLEGRDPESDGTFPTEQRPRMEPHPPHHAAVAADPLDR